ncbi:hypothetical protein K4F52_000582 [Lecanicillium sp. MT-2017a]|nr:hypothetical protein K4F52_000582 [Lecanicillium sp. MT-2017a]
MTLKHILPVLPLLGAATAFPRPRSDATIDWQTCQDPVIQTTLPADCANFTVPLDYTTPGGETIELQLARINAPKQPAKGTILLNFGGPGQEARGNLAVQAPTLLALSGGEYNLAAFDPRGVANTIPHYCFDTAQEFTDFIQAQTWYDANDTSMEDLWDRATEDVQTCLEAHEKIQPFLGTAFVARDLLSVAEALGEDGMLRYWAEQLEADTWDMVDGLKENPVPIGNGSIVLSYPNMRNLLAYSLYGPSSWPQVAEVLNYMRTNDTSNPKFVTIAQTLYQVLVASTVSFPPLYGIHCSDRIPRLDTLDEFLPVQEKLNNISKVMDGTSTLLSMTCAQWKTDAKERYEGDFQVETKNPVLVSTNKYDGHTPIRSAQNVSSGFEGSGMLVVNGFGTAAYWVNGTLPDEDFICEVDAVPYGDYTWADAIKEVAGGLQGGGSGNNTNNGNGSDTGGSGNDNGGNGGDSGGGDENLPPVNGAGKIAGTLSGVFFATGLVLAVNSGLF